MLIKTCVSVYLVLVILMSIYNRFSANKGSIIRNKFTNAAYIFGASVGGTTIFGITTKAYLINLEYCLGAIISIATFDVFFSVIIYPKIREKLQNITIGELMNKKYGNLGQLIMGIAACTVTTGYLAAQINVLIQIFEHVLLLSKKHTCMFFIFYFLLYNFVNNTNSKKNNLYFIILTSSVLLLAFYSLKKIGGYKYLLYSAQNQYKQLDLLNLIKDSIVIATCFGCSNLNPATIKRTSMIPKKHLIESCLIKILISIILIFILTLNGYTSRIFLGESKINLNIVPWMITNMLPIYAQIFVTLGVISAVLMNTDADLQVLKNSVKIDILKTYKPFYKILHIKNIESIIAAISLIIAIIIALIFNDVVDIILLFIGTWFPYFGILIIASLYNVFLGKKTLIINCIIIESMFIIINILFPEKRFLGTVVASISNALFFYIYSMLTKNRLNRYIKF